METGENGSQFESAPTKELIEDQFEGQGEKMINQQEEIYPVNEEKDAIEKLDVPIVDERMPVSSRTHDDERVDAFTFMKQIAETTENMLSNSNMFGTETEASTVATEKLGDTEGMPDFSNIFNVMIPVEALDALPSPLKGDGASMNCDAPISNLVSDLHPDFPLYMETLERMKESQAHRNAVDYVRNMSPNSLSLALFSMAQANANANGTANEDTDLQDQTSGENSKTYSLTNIKTENVTVNNEATGYPGSMLHNSAPEYDINVLESFIENSNENGETSEGYSQPTRQQENQAYVQEVIDQNQQNGWSPSGNHYIGNIHNHNYIYPQLYPSYEEQQFHHNQEDIQSQPPGILYFPPFMVDKEYLKNFSEALSTATDPISATRQNLNDITNDISINNNASSSFPSGSQSIEELLNNCKAALNLENLGLKPSNSPYSDQQIFKYLENTANDMLPNDSVKLEKKVRGRSCPGTGKPGKYKCEDCGRSFNRLYTLNTHQRIHTGEKPYLCEICGVGFRQSGTKLNHIRAVHTKDRPFECRFCGKTFSHKSSITVHTRIHTKEKPYECEHCARRFTDRATYLKHQSIHTGIKPYRCPVCEKCFSQKSNLKRHFKNIHQQDQENVVSESIAAAVQAALLDQ